MYVRFTSPRIISFVFYCVSNLESIQQDLSKRMECEQVLRNSSVDTKYTKETVW
jgi:hypothetical protein